jgi:uncharacterized protein
MTKGKKPHRSEEEYFMQQELERRKKWAAEQTAKMAAEEKKQRKELHWMKCPKCGMDLKEIDMLGVKVDNCDSCGGLFLDHGEINHLMEAGKKDRGMLGRLFSVFD